MFISGQQKNKIMMTAYEKAVTYDEMSLLFSEHVLIVDTWKISVKTLQYTL